MKKVLMLVAILGIAATGIAQCTIKGVSPEERLYRANPPRGYYSTQYVPQYEQGYGYNQPRGGMRNYQGQPLKQTPYQYQDQTGNSSANDQQIYNDLSASLKDYRLGITVKEGVVTLQGTVNSNQDKKRVEDIVYSYAGVKRVNNMIRVSGDNQNQQGQTQSYSYSRNR